MSDIKITGELRTKLRQALQANAGWLNYKAAIGKSIAEFTKDDYITACNALHIDLNKLAIETNAGAEEMADRDRSVTREEVTALLNRFLLIEDKMRSADMHFVRSVLETIRNKQDHTASQKQKSAIERTLAKYETTAAENASAAEQKTFFELPPVTAPAGGDAAGAALAAMVSPHIAAQLLPVVMASVERRLETVSTVRFEFAKEGATVGTSEGHHHPHFATLCKALTARQVDGFSPAVWIGGPAGSGKTYAAKTFAKAAGMEFYFNGAVAMVHELLGYMDGNGNYHRTPFRDAYEHGGTYVFDEVDGSDNAALLALNAALANGKCAFPDGIIERHKDCHIIATANTWGLGGTNDYCGRAKIDAAFLDRFGVRLDWQYDAALELAIAGNPDFTRRVQAARERARAAGLKVLITPRASIAGAALINQGMTHDEAATFTYLANLSADQRKIVEGR